MGQYKVTGSSAFLGHKPGDSFSADLTPEHEARAIARGSISKAKGTPKKDKPAEDGGDQASAE